MCFKRTITIYLIILWGGKLPVAYYGLMKGIFHDRFFLVIIKTGT